MIEVVSWAATRVVAAKSRIAALLRRAPSILGLVLEFHGA